MWDEILTSLWFFAPAGFANLAPVLAAQLPLLDKLNAPVDGRRKFRGKRLLGNNKTYRGFVVGVLIAYFTLLWQKTLIANGSWPIDNTLFNYDNENLILLGFAFGFGALAGDAIKSFFKRQKGLVPGRPWFPFDQLDYVVGGLLLAVPLTGVGFSEIIWVVVVYFLLHPVSTVIGYLLGLKEKPI